MAALPDYFALVRQMKNPYSLRLALVDYARAHGIKAAGRAFQTTLCTVRKGLRRYQERGAQGLEELSRASRSCPHKTRGEIEQRVVLRRRRPTFSAPRLQRDFGRPVSPATAYRIWRQHGLVLRRRRKYQRQQDRAAVKATGALFQQISTDTKDLDDIPHYWARRQARGLPLIQYTAREVRSGLQFLAFAQHRSPGASAAFAFRLQSHFQRCGVNLKDVTWQTGNGGEFVGERQPDGSRSGFPRAVTFFGSQHVRVPPAARGSDRPRLPEANPEGEDPSAASGTEGDSLGSTVFSGISEAADGIGFGAACAAALKFRAWR